MEALARPGRWPATRCSRSCSRSRTSPETSKPPGTCPASRPDPRAPGPEAARFDLAVTLRERRDSGWRPGRDRGGAAVRGGLVRPGDGGGAGRAAGAGAGAGGGGSAVCGSARWRCSARASAARSWVAGTTPTAECRPLTLAELFERRWRGRRMPRRWCAGMRCWSYAELDAASSRLAGYLIGLGAGPEQVVAIAVPRSAEMVVAVLAWPRPGRRTCRSTRGIPADRISFMLADARPRWSYAPRKPRTLRWRLGGRWCWMTRPRRPRHAPGAAPDGPGSRGWVWLAPAYVIYTSGSTGVPKGVVVTHRGLAGLVAERRRTGSRSGRGRGCCSSPRSASTRPVWSWRSPLVRAAALVLAPAGCRSADAVVAGAGDPRDRAAVRAGATVEARRCRSRYGPWWSRGRHARPRWPPGGRGMHRGDQRLRADRGDGVRAR